MRLNSILWWIFSESKLSADAPEFQPEAKKKKEEAGKEGEQV